MDGWGSRRVAVEFESEGAVIRGFLYKAVKGNPPFPMVVMAHGTSATIPMVADRYAEVFAEAECRPSSMTIGIWGSVVGSAKRSTRGCKPAAIETPSPSPRPSKTTIRTGSECGATHILLGRFSWWLPATLGSKWSWPNAPSSAPPRLTSSRHVKCSKRSLRPSNPVTSPVGQALRLVQSLSSHRTS